MGTAGVPGLQLTFHPPPIPQSSLAQWGASAAMQVVSRRRSEVRVPWLHNLAAAQDEDHDDRTDTEGEETEEEEESDMEENQLNEVRGRAEAEWGRGRLKVPRPLEGRKAEARGETGVCAPRPRDVAHMRLSSDPLPRQPAKHFHAFL